MVHGQGGEEITEGYAPTLNCNHEQPIVLQINMQTATKNGAKSPNMLGIGKDGDPAHTLGASDQHAVAFSAGNSDGSRSIGYSEEHTPPLRAGASGTNMTPTIAVAPSLVSNGDAHSGFRDEHGIIQHLMQVRRLTPLECHRLQGFPDDYLSQVPGASDTQMYKALGNSMACNVMQLIGQRIQMVNDLIED